MSLDEGLLVPLSRLADTIVEVSLIRNLVVLFDGQVLKVFVDKQKLNRKLLDFRGFRLSLTLSIFEEV